MKLLKNILFFNITRLWKAERANYHRKPNVPASVKTDQEIQQFFDKLLENKQWCDRTTEHWAEVKVFELSKAIITFNLGLLAFDGAAQNLFINSDFLLLSILFSTSSLSLLIWFIWSTTNKNINNASDRGYLFQDTVANFLSDRSGTFKKFESGLNQSFEDLRDHELIWFPLQRVGIYLFLFAIISSVLGIIDLGTRY